MFYFFQNSSVIYFEHVLTNGHVLIENGHAYSTDFTGKFVIQAEQKMLLDPEALISRPTLQSGLRSSVFVRCVFLWIFGFTYSPFEFKQSKVSRYFLIDTAYFFDV